MLEVCSACYPKLVPVILFLDEKVLDIFIYLFIYLFIYTCLPTLLSGVTPIPLYVSHFFRTRIYVNILLFVIHIDIHKRNLIYGLMDISSHTRDRGVRQMLPVHSYWTLILINSLWWNQWQGKTGVRPVTELSLMESYSMSHIIP